MSEYSSGFRSGQPHLVRPGSGIKAEVYDLQQEIIRTFDKVPWLPPATTVLDLPLVGNHPGDVRVVLAPLPMAAYVWTGAAWQIVAGSGGGSDFTFPDRVDCSVNNARVENLYSTMPFLHCQTGGNVAGGYNGGGVGNKSILGIRAGDNLALGSLVNLAYTWLDLAPAIVGLVTYCNLIVDINGDGSVYKVFVVDPTGAPALNTNTTVTNGDGSKTTTFAAASNYVLVVDDLAGVIPIVNLGVGWQNHAYDIADILVVYPAAQLKEASSLDTGLPSLMVTPAFLLITGDSTSNKIRTYRLSNISFNGVTV